MRGKLPGGLSICLSVCLCIVSVLLSVSLLLSALLLLQPLRSVYQIRLNLDLSLSFSKL